MAHSILPTEGVNQLFNRFVDASGSKGAAVVCGTAGAFAVIGGLYTFTHTIFNRDGYIKGKKIAQYKKADVETVYDVAVVGAGPSGSTLGYYLCRNNSGHKVLLLDKKKFPRDKYCGDAVCTGAQNHLQEMGVLQEIVAEKKGLFAQAGGFVSPGGYSYIGNSATILNLDNRGAAIAIKRIVMDEKIAKAAQKAGALLTENTSVESATFNRETGLWKVECKYTGGNENEDDAGVPVTYYARVLICADGAASGLATKLNYVNTPPQGICSRQYIKENEYFNIDGCVFYTPQLLPGYCAIFREAGGHVNFCTYIIPGGPAQNEDLPKIHDDIMKNDPYVSACLGPNPEITERMRSAGLRLGGIDKSFDDHLLIIGDAAGFIDPLTGEGIQYAMQSGYLAAKVLDECLKKGDVSSSALKKYQRLWWNEWGLEFKLSMKVSLFLYRFPSVLDSTVSLIKKRGAKFFATWTEVMTGSKSKSYFLRPDVWPFVLIEIGATAVRKMLGHKTPLQQLNLEVQNEKKVNA
eukprot:TRINITY_DN150_c0_g1_i1.p1 TRINITY_DN150_c0_g1~~TRINITY_DN150_c0_g1_i1.p1  ORF type:complete len:546 (+),score=170.17 TRINITY_DN150_c0_g1_i1:76-1638(+)